MESDEKIVRVETLDDFDRELARDGGEALEVPASLAEQYGLFPRTWAPKTRSGTRAGRRRQTDETRRISPPVRRCDHRADPPGHGTVAEALGAGRARAPRERRYRTLLLGREQPASRRRRTGARLRRRPLGNLPSDPGPRRPGAEGASRAPASSPSRTTGRSPSPTSAAGPSGTTKASASTATSGCARLSSGSTPCSTPSRPTDCRPGPRPLPSRSGRRTSRPRGCWKTAGFPSVTWLATGRSTT